jgi:hypothetical protein
MLAAAKALADMARESRVLAIRGGVLEGRIVSAEEVESLATLPPLEILRGQVLGAIVAPLTSFAGLVSAPLQSLYGLLDARIEQLGGEEPATKEPEAEAAAVPVDPEPAVEAEAAAEDKQASATADASEETVQEES